MLKNTAGQKIGATLVSATDGSAFSGDVTVYVTVDAGTQAAGSVGSGACANEGNSYYTYAPSQAETNGDLIAFTFVGTGAVPATVQVYTRAVAEGVLTASERNSVADAVFSRDMDQVEGSAPLHSLTGAVLKLVSKVDDDGAGSLVTYKTDGSTAFSKQAITTGASLEPIDALGVFTTP